MHEGIDIKANPGTPVYAMCKSEITNIRGNTVTLIARDENEVHFWIDEDATTQVRATYENFTPVAGLSEGEIVSAGQQIGIVSDAKKCNGHETNAPYTYLHIKTEIKKNRITWQTIDPFLLIG